jgi:MFS family permease
MLRLTGRLGPLREREFRLFFVGHSISVVGDGMAPLALAFAILGLTGSVSSLGFVFAARTVTMVAFLLIGGVIADRASRRTVMLVADVVRFGSQGATAALLIGGHAQIWQLVVLQAVNGCATGFFFPAVTGLTPLVVSEARLQQANALRGLAMSGGEIVGPLIAGALVATAGAGWALAGDAATFGVSAVFLAQLRRPAQEALVSRPFVRDLLEGWNEFRSRTWLWAGVGAAGLGNMAFAAFIVLGAVISKQSLGGATAWASILAAFNAGSVVGGLAALRLRPRRPFFAAFVAYLTFPAATILLALRVDAWEIAMGAFVTGFGLLFGNALWETTLQEQVPPAVLSRVTAYDWFGSLAFQPLGYVLVGPVAAALGASGTLWAGATLMLVVTAAVLTLPSVRQIEARAPAPEAVPP